jgi:hypothetical protein
LGDARFVGTRRGVVYVGCSKQARIAYVGQTAGERGVLARWSDHLGSSSSSFWRRVLERGDCDVDSITDLEVFAAELGEDAQWNSIEASHREAVEYLVQRGLRLVSGDLVPYLRVISHVRANETCSLESVRQKAEVVLDAFLTWYSG